MLENPPTRRQSTEEIRAHLRRLMRERCSVFVGFEFPLGYPRGFAARLGLGGPAPWRDTWDYLAAAIRDEEQNRNNRFEVAAELNKRCSGRAFPFRGCPPSRATKFLSPRKDGWRAAAPILSERRLTERRHRRAQPVWKLYTTGAAGSQALLGIPRVASLRFDPELASVSRVWPFETGLRLAVRTGRGGRIVYAEVYPSLTRPRGNHIVKTPIKWRPSPATSPDWRPAGNSAPSSPSISITRTAKR